MSRIACSCSFSRSSAASRLRFASSAPRDSETAIEVISQNNKALMASVAAKIAVIPALFRRSTGSSRGTIRSSHSRSPTARRWVTPYPENSAGATAGAAAPDAGCQTAACPLPRLDRPRDAAAAVQGETQERAAHAGVAVPQQGDSRARRHLARVPRALGDGAAQRIGVEVESPRGDVLAHGLDVGQYRVLRALARGLDDKLRQPFDQGTRLGAHRALELKLLCMRDAGRKRNVGDSRVTLTQGERLRELVKLVPGHLVGSVEQPAQRVEHVPVGADSRLHVVGDADRDGPEPRACFLPHLDADVIRAGGGKREARREHGPAQPPMAHRQLLQPCDQIRLRVIGCGHGYSPALSRALAFRPLVYAFAFPEENGDLVEIDGLAEEIALQLVASEPIQYLGLFLRIDALGDDFEPQRMSH